jgi:hypothetical protein
MNSNNSHKHAYQLLYNSWSHLAYPHTLYTTTTSLLHIEFLQLLYNVNTVSYKDITQVLEYLYQHFTRIFYE